LRSVVSDLFARLLGSISPNWFSYVLRRIAASNPKRTS